MLMLETEAKARYGKKVRYGDGDNDPGNDAETMMIERTRDSYEAGYLSI